MIKKLKYVLFEQGLIRYLRFKFDLKFQLIGKKISTIFFKGRWIKIWVDEKNGFIDEHIYKYGTYEVDVLAKLVKLLNRNSNVVDIGANIGQHSLIFSRFAKHVYSFEPITRLFNQFSDSINLNAFTNITPYNFAISDKSESKTIYLNDLNIGRSSLLINEENKGNAKLEVNLVSLSAQLGTIDKIDFVKIDVEGFEPNVILGNQEFFLKHKPIIFVEITPYDYKDEQYSFDRLFNFFISGGYNIFSWNTKKYISNIDEVDVDSQDNWLLTVEKL